MTVENVFLVVYVVVCCATLLVFIWGWIRWVRQPKQRTLTAIFALSGFALATASAVLAISSLIYAHAVGGFPFYDPRLLRIYRWGCRLSLMGLFFGIAGAWRPSALRWHAITGSAGTLFYWIVAAESE